MNLRKDQFNTQGTGLITCCLFQFSGKPFLLYLSNSKLENLSKFELDFDPCLLLGPVRSIEKRTKIELEMDHVYTSDDRSYVMGSIPGYEFCWRNLLSETWKTLDENIFQISIELEFFLFGTNTMKKNFFKALMQKSHELNFQLTGIVDELGDNQYELRMDFKDPRNFLDQFYLIRLIMMDFAENFELDLNFIPKNNKIPFGNGVHIRVQFEDEKKANQIATFFVNHAEALAVFFNPTVNSYKRLHFGDEAPKYICMGTTKYFPLIAVEGNYVEFRSPDNFSNIPAILYILGKTLETKSFLLESLSHQALERSPFEMSARDRSKFKIKEMPHDLGEAIKAFRLDKDMLFILGEARHRQMIDLLTHEWKEFLRITHSWEEERFKHP